METPLHQKFKVFIEQISIKDIYGSPTILKASVKYCTGSFCADRRALTIFIHQKNIHIGCGSLVSCWHLGEASMNQACWQIKMLAVCRTCQRLELLVQPFLNFCCARARWPAKAWCCCHAVAMEEGCASSAARFRWVVCVKVTSTWMPGPQVSLSNIRL